MKKKESLPTIRSSAAEYLTFVAATGDSSASFEMRYQDENIWLTQKMMAALYDVSVQNIGQHIKRVFDDGELSPDSVIKKYFITAPDGKDYGTMHYNLQMIIAVGFKVNNERAAPTSSIISYLNMRSLKSRVKQGAGSSGGVFFVTNPLIARYIYDNVDCFYLLYFIKGSAV